MTKPCGAYHLLYKSHPVCTDVGLFARFVRGSSSRIGPLRLAIGFVTRLRNSSFGHVSGRQCPRRCHKLTFLYKNLISKSSALLQTNFIIPGQTF